MSSCRSRTLICSTGPAADGAILRTSIRPFDTWRYSMSFSIPPTGPGSCGSGLQHREDDGRSECVLPWADGPGFDRVDDEVVVAIATLEDLLRPLLDSLDALPSMLPDKPL